MPDKQLLADLENEVTMRDLCKTSYGLAIRVATVLHDGVYDKTGAPYIEHPLAVAVAMDIEDDKVAAVLHDVVEDTIATLDFLRTLGFDEEDVVAVDHLSRREYPDGTKEPYDDFIQRCCLNDRARRIKKRDIEHNMIPARLRKLDKKFQLKLKTKYRKALKYIESYELKLRSN